MTPFESGGSGGTSLTLSKRYSAAFSSDGQAARATDSPGRRADPRRGRRAARARIRRRRGRSRARMSRLQLTTTHSTTTADSDPPRTHWADRRVSQSPGRVHLRVSFGCRRHTSEYNPGKVLQTLRRLLRGRQVPSAAMRRPERPPDELERERDLLERIAAGIALNKTPGR